MDNTNTSNNTNDKPLFNGAPVLVETQRDERDCTFEIIHWRCWCGHDLTATVIFETWETCPACGQQWRVGGRAKAILPVYPWKPAK